MKTVAKRLFKGGIVLSVTALLIRTIGVGANVYISSRIGAAGMGLLTLIMSVYSFAVTFAVSGVALAATRMTAEAVGAGMDSAVRDSMRSCLTYSLAFGATAALLLLSLAEPIGTYLLGDARCVRSIRIFALGMPFVSMSSAVHGYLTALGRAGRSAAVQIGEQVVKVFATVLLLEALSERGVEYACIAVIAGGSIAEILSFATAFTLYAYDVKKSFPKQKKAQSHHPWKKLFSIALPVAFSSYLRSGLVTLEHMLIPRGLKSYGASSEHSLEVYGVLQGMVLPIVLFPTAFLSSFNMLLVPELAIAASRGEKRRIVSIGERFLRYTLLFSIGVCSVMICFSDELGQVIYNSHDASNFIKTVAPLIPVMYLDSAVDSVLKGLDEQLYNMRVNIIDAASSVLMVYLLCPRIGIMGYIVTIFASELFNLSCSFVRLTNVTEIKPHICSWIVKPTACALGACTLVRCLLEAVFVCEYSYAMLFFHIALTLTVYVLLLLLTCTLEHNDRSFICSLLKPARDSG